MMRRFRAASAAFLIGILPVILFAAVQDYSTSAGGNTAAPPNGAPEGMAPSTVNDTMRQMMANTAIEAQVNRVKVINSVGGTANAITGSLTPALTAYSPGMLLVLTPASTNTGATTLNVNSLGALDVQTADGDALVAADLTAGIPAVLVLDAGSDDWTLLNPQASVNGVAFSDLARLSQVNTFTGNIQEIQHGTPIWASDETDAPADERNWFWRSDSGLLRLCIATDALPLSCAASPVTFDRAGAAVGPIAFSANGFTVNGSTIWHAGNDGDGSGLDADTLAGLSDTAYAKLSQGNAFTQVQTINATAGGSGQLGLRGASTPDPSAFAAFIDSGGTRRGWVGFGAADSSIRLTNEMSAGALNLVTAGGGAVQVNGQNIRDTALFTSGTLPVARGGTGTTTATGTGSVVLSASPALTGSPTVGGQNVCLANGTNCPAGSVPGGSDTQVQYNQAGALGGDAGMTYSAGTDTLTVGSIIGNGSGLTSLDAGDISAGTLPVARGGTGTTTSTGTGSAVLSASPTFTGTVTAAGLSVGGPTSYNSAVSATLVADQNDYNPAGLSTATLLKLTANGGFRTLTGLAGGSEARVIIICATGDSTIVLANESASSAAANRFFMPGAFDLNVTARGCSHIIYDSVISMWRRLGL